MADPEGENGRTPGYLHRVRLIDVGAVTLEVHECVQATPAQARGAASAPRRLALCLHGFPEHAHAWRHQMEPLAAQGYRVWAPNLRGYGNSSRPPRMRDYAIEQLLDDVAGLIDASGTDETLLVGHDWGAIIAWYFAMRRVRPVAHLAILNVPHPAPLAREFRVSARQRRRSWYTLLFQLPHLPEWLIGRRQGSGIAEMFRNATVRPGAIAAEDAEVFARNLRHPGAPKAMIDYYRAMGAGGGASRQHRLGQPTIEVPTLLIWGEQDIALTKASTYGTENWVSSLTVRYLPQASHWVQQDDPERVNAMLTAFVTGAEVPHAEGARGDRDPA